MLCTNCGEEVAAGADYCQNCGVKITGVPTQAPFPPPSTQQESQSHKKRNIGIALATVALILILIGATLVVILPATHDVYITSIDVRSQLSFTSSGGLGLSSSTIGTFHSFPVNKVVVEGKQFTFNLTLPAQSALQCNAVVTINSITSETQGFTIESTTPSLPATLNSPSSTSIIMKVIVPSQKYTGVLNLFVTDAATCVAGQTV